MNIKRLFNVYKRVSHVKIINIYKRVSHVKTPLGRWNNHNYNETLLKIKYATEDNCGISCHDNKKIT